MRGFGRFLVGTGIVVGVATGLALLLDVNVPGVGSWLVGVAVAKLAFFSALALIAVGTVLQRRAAQERVREERLAAETAPHSLQEGAGPAEPLPGAERETRAMRDSRPG